MGNRRGTFSIRSHGRHEKEQKLKFFTDQQGQCNFTSPFCCSSVLQHNPETICKAEQKNVWESSRLIKFLARMGKNTWVWVLQEGLELWPPRNTSAIPRGKIYSVTQPGISAAATKTLTWKQIHTFSSSQERQLNLLMLKFIKHITVAKIQNCDCKISPSD